MDTPAIGEQVWVSDNSGEHWYLRPVKELQGDHLRVHRSEYHNFWFWPQDDDGCSFMWKTAEVMVL